MPSLGDHAPSFGDVLVPLYGMFIGMNLATIVRRGRQHCISPVGRPPRDLYAERWVNRLVNTIYEWIWLGCVVIFASIVLYFTEATDQYAKYVGYAGLGMVLTCVTVVPLCAARAELNPMYEKQSSASSG